MQPNSLQGLRTAIVELDRNLFRRVHGHHKVRLNQGMKLITHLGDPLGSAALMGGLLVSGKPGRSLVRQVVPAAMMSVAISYALKVSIGRPRPRVGIDNIQALAKDPDKYSFPSAHAASSIAVATRALLERPSIGAPLTALAILISFSRIYVGVHYPLDVIAGIMVGAGTAALQPVWMTILKANVKSSARAIHGVWLHAREVDRGLPPAGRPRPATSASP